MDLTPTPEQRDITKAFGAVFAQHSSSQRVRDAEQRGFDAQLWHLLAELGAVGIAVDDGAGGGGGGLLELVLIAEEAGRRVACVPLVEAAVAARLLARSNRPAAQSLLSRALAGAALVVFTPRATVDGEAPLVIGGAVADAVVVFDERELVVVEGGVAAGVGDLGFVAVADRQLSGGDARRHVLFSADQAETVWRQARREWHVATAAVLSGLGAEALSIGVRYAKERQQFGVPIGAFQAVQQRLAQSAAATEGTELLAREAAWRADRGVVSWAELATVAYAHAGRTAIEACEASLHVHGGYGYTLEYDIQLYLRRAKALAIVDGDPELLWEEIGADAVAAGS